MATRKIMEREKENGTRRYEENEENVVLTSSEIDVVVNWSYGQENVASETDLGDL